MKIFKMCQDSKEKGKRQREEIKSQPRIPNPMQGSIEISSSEILLDETAKITSQIRYLKDDGYFSKKELEYYKKMYANEKIERVPLTVIKYNFYSLI